MEIRIKGITDAHDILDAFEALIGAIGRQPRLMNRDEFVIVKHDPYRLDDEVLADPDTEGDCVFPALPDTEGLPCAETWDIYVPCSRRGQHLRLAECWACWSDVHRGAVVETDVLSDAAWDAGLAEL